MLVANSFDLWQTDAFFSAAEEVQESADILESAYRAWLRQKREGLTSSELEEYQRELQTALGTAKWQLEEFERAVRLSYGNCHDQNRMVRHQQFVVAMESQISQVEDALMESLNGEGKHPLQWVNLDENERNDLAMFLSGSNETSAMRTGDEFLKPSISSQVENLCKKKDLDHATCNSSKNSMEAKTQIKGLTSFGNDVVIDMGAANCSTELGTRGDTNSEAERASSTKRSRISPKFGTLRLMIPDEDNTSMPTIEDTPKVKGFRASNFLYVKGINGINRLFNGSSGLNSILQNHQRIQFNSSMRLIIVLVLLFFLLVPYLLHST